MESLNELLEDCIKDLYSAENQLVKALPKMAKKAASESLREAFLAHLEETEGQVERLESIGKALDIKLKGKKCKAMEGLIEEGKEILEEEGRSAIIDSALIAAAQKVEHYEIASYGTARTIAEQLGESKVAKLLQETLDEEGEADKKLTSLSIEEILPAASSDGEEEEAEEEE